MKKAILAILLVPFVFACSPSVKRVETNLVKDVSGGWNDTDAQMVAQEMITDCLQAAGTINTLPKKVKNRSLLWVLWSIIRPNISIRVCLLKKSNAR